MSWRGFPEKTLERASRSSSTSNRLRDSRRSGINAPTGDGAFTDAGVYRLGVATWRWGGVAGPVIYGAATALAARRVPGYRHVARPISALAAHGSNGAVL